MYTEGPAISLCTSFWDLPQKEQNNSREDFLATFAPLRKGRV
jgi:hypothetical protein